MSGSASMVWALPFTSRLIRAIGCMSPLDVIACGLRALAPAYDLRDQLRLDLMREANPTVRPLEHPRRGSLAGAVPLACAARARARGAPAGLRSRLPGE